MGDKLRKLKHDITGDTEAVKSVLSILSEKIQDEALIGLITSSIERMDKIKKDFIELAEFSSKDS